MKKAIMTSLISLRSFEKSQTITLKNFLSQRVKWMVIRLFGKLSSVLKVQF